MSRRSLIAAGLFVVLGVSRVAAPEGAGIRIEPLNEEQLNAALDANNPADAPVVAARAAAAKAPQDAAARLALGDAFIARGFVPEGRREYDAVTELKPDLSKGWNNLGVALHLLDDEKRSQAAFERALEVDARNAEAQFNLGAALERQGFFEESVRHYKESFRLLPELGDPLRNPRVRLMRVIVPVRLSLYLETAGGLTLPPQGNALAPLPSPSPASHRRGAASAPPRPNSPLTAPVVKDDPAATGDPAAPVPPAATDPAPPTAAPTPIVLGPDSVPAPARSDIAPAQPPGRPGRSVRRGGPMPPRPTPTSDE